MPVCLNWVGRYKCQKVSSFPCFGSAKFTGSSKFSQEQNYFFAFMRYQILFKKIKDFLLQLQKRKARNVAFNFSKRVKAKFN
jgi:hypothetical protein